MSVYGEIIPTLRPQILMPQWSQMEDVLNEQLDLLWLGKKDINEVCAKIDKYFNEILNQKKQ